MRKTAIKTDRLQPAESMKPLEIVNYPHPVLRYQAKPLRRVDQALKNMAAEMLELMYAHRGVGLAATQVNLPFQMFVLDPSGEADSGQVRVLVNPVLQSPKGKAEAEEGCLSLPNVYGQVVRPAQIHLVAYDLSGNLVDEVIEGMLARVVQHEVDHLQGVLFPDRMSEAARKTIQPELEAFDIEFETLLKQNPEWHVEAVNLRLARLESEYC